MRPIRRHSMVACSYREPFKSYFESRPESACGGKQFFLGRSMGHLRQMREM